MNIQHHPTEELLVSFAAGRLEQAEHIVVAAHVAMCSQCRRLVRAFEAVGGMSIETAEPSAMAMDAFSRAMLRVENGIPANPPGAPASIDASRDGWGRLPQGLRHYEIGPVRRVAPGVSMRPIRMPAAGKARAFLLRSEPGTRMLEHAHTATELTCVLEGSFTHQGGRFGRGDFDLGDEKVDHQPMVGTEEACVCLVAMTGNLHFNGLLGRVVGPFIRL